ncbi:MAG TPA: four helix bundle protein [Pirellulaceae bacterium]|nr:four helix bundle protein [Pirellulaceae bacterium]
MAISSFKDLIVWQKSIELIEEVYRLSATFPKQETYGLSSQLQRAAVSIAANIAEGSGRHSTKEYVHHLSYSLGSLAEVETYFVVCVKLGYATQKSVSSLETKADQIGKMLRSLQKALRRKLGPDDECP